MFQKPTVCQGMTSVVPKKSRRSPGFSPCRTEAGFRQTIFETRSSLPQLSGFPRVWIPQDGYSVGIEGLGVNAFRAGAFEWMSAFATE